VKLRETFFYKHLWVVCSLPTADGSVVVFNFTTHRFPCDENCIVEPGEHPYVKQKTVVAYEHGMLFGLKQQQGILSNPTLCPPHQPVSSALLAKIQAGALSSDLTKQALQSIIGDSMTRQAAGPP
jgi:hypothetical protein